MFFPVASFVGVFFGNKWAGYHFFREVYRSRRNLYGSLDAGEEVFAIGCSAIVGSECEFPHEESRIKFLWDLAVGLFTGTKERLYFVSDNKLEDRDQLFAQQFVLAYAFRVAEYKKFTAEIEAGAGHAAIGFGKGKDFKTTTNFLSPGINLIYNLRNNYKLKLNSTYLLFSNFQPVTMLSELKNSYFVIRLIFGAK